MEKICKGCGIVLQTENQNELGYVPNIEMDICQRCFRIMHYDAHDKEISFFDNKKIIDELNNLEGTFIWIIDIFDLENSLHCFLTDFFRKHECIVFLNKFDLLPARCNVALIKKKVLKRLKQMNINVVDMIYRNSKEDFFSLFKFKVIENNPDNNYIFCGCANVGKSTIINSLLDHDLLTVNRYPATSIQTHRIHTEIADFIDTIGIVNNDNLVSYLSTSQLKTVVPINPIRVKTYQIVQPQSIILAGLAKIDIYPKDDCSVGIYCSNLVSQYRGKIENASGYFKREYNKEFQPTVGKYSELKENVFTTIKTPCDIVINGLGWISLHGNIDRIEIKVNNKISVYIREVLI